MIRFEKIRHEILKFSEEKENFNGKKMFKKIINFRNKPQQVVIEEAIEAENFIEFQKRPRICLIDVDKDEFQALKSKGFNCIKGSFGSLIDLPNQELRDSSFCLLNHSLPENIHEYNIIAIDLNNNDRIKYELSDHQYSAVKHEIKTFFICQYPQTLFDPKPLSAYILRSQIEEFKNKDSIMIVFASQFESVSYNPMTLTASGYRPETSQRHDNYSFLLNYHILTNRFGIETKVVLDGNNDLTRFIKKYNDKFIYHITFTHPTHWEGEKRVKNENFIPLILSSDGQIVSYMKIDNKLITFVFPQLENKTYFLVELFQNILPSVFPNLFPYSNEFTWLSDEEYRLPNQTNLLREKDQLKKCYELKNKSIDEKIKVNNNKYSFLHDLLTQTGDQLVKTVEYYLNWLEFEKVINLDEVSEGPNEEDLQISIDQGLLVVEVKGIGGTSKDSDCSQVNKIKYRRAKERGTFDVFALYIVNHQRHLPPKNRLNPPFSAQQIEDAKNEERGLLTTYNLFKLYFFINAGYITKADARKALLDYGLVTFKPSNAVSIGKSTEFFRKNTVGIFVIEDTLIRLNGEILIFEDDNYTRTKIIGIQVNDQKMNEVSNGEVGLQFSTKITKRSEIWILNNF